MARPRTTPRKLPRQKRAQDTVAAILEATRRVLVQHGYAGSSVSEIARLAGVSIGSLYQYFPSKEALVMALSQQHSAAMQQVFRDRIAAARELPLRAAIRLIIQTEVEALQADPALYRVLFEEVPRFGDPDHIVSVQAQVIDLIREELVRRAGPLPVADADQVAFLLVYALDGVVQAALQRRPELLRSPAFLEHCTDLVVRYLQPAA